MKRQILHIVFVLVFFLGFSCQNNSGLNPDLTKMDDSAKIQSEVTTWTAAATYPYTVSQSNISYTSKNRDPFTRLVEIESGYNGIAPDLYSYNLDHLDWTVNYPFPSGITYFFQLPQVTITDIIPDTYVQDITYFDHWFYKAIGIINITAKRCWNFTLETDLLYITSVNKEYTCNLSEAKISYTASGVLRKYKDGISAGTYYIETGVSGLSINDIDFLFYASTPGLTSCTCSDPWMSGTKVYFTVTIEVEGGEPID